MCPDVYYECSENCDDKLIGFLKRTYYVDAGHDNKEGMVRLNSRMAQIEVEFDLISISESFGKLEIEITFIKFHHTHFCFTEHWCCKQNILPCCSTRGTP